MKRIKFEAIMDSFSINKESKIKLSISSIFVADVIETLQFLNESFKLGLKMTEEDEDIKLVIESVFAKNSNFNHEGSSKLDLLFDHTKVDLNLLGKFKNKLCTVVCLEEEGLT